MVSLLEQNGADIYQINNQGLTVLHIAAQGDSPLLMVDHYK
jgi:ankyrin repeat protein